MMMRTKLLLAAATAALCACGGGDSGGDVFTAGSGGGSPSQAQGLWTGTTNTNRTATALVFSDGTFYLLYSVAGNPALIAGTTQGHSTATATTFNSTDGRDFNLEGLGVLSGSVSGTYTARQSISGTVSYAGGGTVSFTANYDASYEITPTLAAITGTFTGQVGSPTGGVQSAVFTVASNGTFTGSASGCAASGSLTPRSDANAYNAVINYGPAPCLFPGQTFAGAAYYNAPTKALYAVALNAARSNAGIFVGTKP